MFAAVIFLATIPSLRCENDDKNCFVNNDSLSIDLSSANRWYYNRFNALQSTVMVLKNMVSFEDVDDELEGEVSVYITFI